MAPTVDVDRVGRLISSIGLPSFGAHYFDLFCAGMGVDQCTVFAFRGSQPPDPLVLEGKSLKMRQVAHALATEYMAGAFTQDPNVHRQAKLSVPTVRCLSAEEVPDRKYRLRFYDRPCLAHELVLLGQTDDILYYSSFYRSDRRTPFQSTDVQLMSGMASLALRTLHRHLELLGGVGLQNWKTATPGTDSGGRHRRQEMAAHLQNVLLAEPYDLSPREAEVCAGIILGYTTLGISLNFGISVNTVATHRKRAYRKLGVSSQNELFSRYFQVVNQQPQRESEITLGTNPLPQVSRDLFASSAVQEPSAA
jgi:DNA-binding CsgD family transcriptional regulator